MNLKRKSALVGEAIAERGVAILKPLSAPAGKVISLGERDASGKVSASKSGGNSQVTAVLEDMAEQVRQLAATLESLRADLK